jgi:ABC-type transport system involved in multi-copper enzyme maturation permease subunit
MIDTRAGFWLLLSIALLTLTVITLVAIFGKAAERGFESQFAVAIAPSTFLLPIVGILLVSSEFSQRTALITFTLVPQRLRVVGAKLVAGLLASIVATAIALAVAAIAVLAAGGAWDMRSGIFLQIVLLALTSVVTGIAFGAAFLNSAPAIVFSFVLPIVFSMVGGLIGWGIFDWLDTGATTESMMDTVFNGREWAQWCVSTGLWMLVPLAVGLWRIAYADIRTT